MIVRISKFRPTLASEDKRTSTGKRIVASIVFAEAIGGTDVVTLTEGQLRELAGPLGIQSSPDGINALAVMLNSTAGAGNSAEVEVTEHKKGDKYLDRGGDDQEYTKDWTEVRVKSLVPSSILGTALLKAATDKVVNSWGSWGGPTFDEIPISKGI